MMPSAKPAWREPLNSSVRCACAAQCGDDGVVLGCDDGTLRVYALHGGGGGSGLARPPDATLRAAMRWRRRAPYPPRARFVRTGHVFWCYRSY